MVIRAARPDDYPTLVAIEHAADERFAEAGHAELLNGDALPEDVALRAIAGGRLTVAEVDGAVAGWIFVTRSGGELCIGEVSVAPAHGRRGVGTALLTAVIERARAAGERTIVLNTQADVPWNKPWYERHGFAVVPPEVWTADMHVIADEQRAHGFDWSTRVHMRLTLG